MSNTEQNNTYGQSVEAKNFINGEEVQAHSSQNLITSKNPSDLSDTVGTAPLSRSEEVDGAIKAAQAQKKKWRETPAPVRANYIGKLGRLLSEQKDYLAYIITREIGKTFKEAQGEVQEAIDTCQFFQSEGRRLYGQTVPSEMRQKELYTFRRPYGVVAMITPSNFPLAVPSWKAIPALVTGNTVVWKTAPEAPIIGYLFAKLMHMAGIPKGVFNVIHGDGKTGEILLEGVNQNLIDKVSFTGSTRVGRIVGETCGRNLQIPSLELGGKNPLIVMEDAALDQAVEGAFWAAYGTGGQRCTSAGNIILHDEIYDAFKSKFLKKLEDIKIGNPLKHKDVLFGPMIAEHYQNNYFDHFSRETQSKLIFGCPEPATAQNKPKNFVGDPKDGYYVWPSLWDEVKIDHWIAQNEVFGPTVSLIRVQSIDEAIEVANGTIYGLSSAIYTNNRRYAHRFRNEIEAGMSSVNNSTTGAEAHLPFGGVKASGNGTRESGIWVLDAYTQWQAVNDDLADKLQLAQMDTEGIDEKADIQVSLEKYCGSLDRLR